MIRRIVYVLIWLIVAAMAAIAACGADDEPTHPTGLIVPPNHAAQARFHNVRVAGVMAGLDDARRRAGIGAMQTIPDTWDWRALGVGVGVRNQGSCGACWAFTTVAVLEGAAAIAGRSVDLSEQAVLCCSGAGSCGGGWFDAFDYAVETGVVTEEAFPYTGRYSRCPRPSGGLRALAWGYVEDSGGTPTVEAMQRALLRYGPLAIAIRADGALSRYRPGTVWRSPQGSINHAVTLVGYNRAKRAWLIKNSWGEGWGDRGYFWAAWDSNVGYGAAYAVFPPAWLQSGTQSGTPGPGVDCCRTDPPGPGGPLWRIDGPDTAECGSMVRLSLPEVSGGRVAWAPCPAAVANSVIDSGRLSLYFAAPCTAGEYTFVGVISRPEENPVIITHLLRVNGDRPPNPAPRPAPNPEPQPTELGTFGAECRDWARDLVPSAVRAATAGDLAAAFAGVAEQVDAGIIRSLPAAMLAATAATSRAVGREHREVWAPWFDRLNARWQQALDAGELSDLDEIATGARRAAAGLRAAIDRQAPTAESAPPMPIVTPGRSGLRLRRW